MLKNQKNTFLKDIFFQKILQKNKEIFKRNNLDIKKIKILNFNNNELFNNYCDFLPIYQYENKLFMLKHEVSFYLERTQFFLKKYIFLFEKFKKDLSDTIKINTEFFDITYYDNYIQNFKMFNEINDDILFFSKKELNKKIVIDLYDVDNNFELYKNEIKNNFIIIESTLIDNESFNKLPINISDNYFIFYKYPLKKLDKDIFLFYFYLKLLNKYSIIHFDIICLYQCENIIDFEEYLTEINKFIFKIVPFKLYSLKFKKD